MYQGVISRAVGINTRQFLQWGPRLHCLTPRMDITPHHKSVARQDSNPIDPQTMNATDIF